MRRSAADQNPYKTVGPKYLCANDLLWIGSVPKQVFTPYHRVTDSGYRKKFMVSCHVLYCSLKFTLSCTEWCLLGIKISASTYYPYLTLYKECPEFHGYTKHECWSDVHLRNINTSTMIMKFVIICSKHLTVTIFHLASSI